MFGRAFFFSPILQYNHNVDHMERKVENFKNFNKIPLYIYVALNFYFIYCHQVVKILAPKKKNWWSFRILFFQLFYLIIHGFANIFEGPLGEVWTWNPNPKP
jgi:hypothetical protein